MFLKCSLRLRFVMLFVARIIAAMKKVNRSVYFPGAISEYKQVNTGVLDEKFMYRSVYFG